MKKGVLIILSLALVVIVGVTIIFFLASKPSDKPTYDYLAEAENFLNSNQYSKATQSFKKAINIDSSNINAYIELSNLYISKNDLTSASELVSKVVDTLDNQSLNYQMAYIYYLSGSLDKSEIYLTKIAPNFVVPDNLKLGSKQEISSKDLLKLIVKVLGKEDKNDQSKKALETFLENTKSTDAYLNLLASLLNYATLDNANSYFQRVVSFDSKDNIEQLHTISDSLKAVLSSTASDTKGEFADTNKSNVARMLIDLDHNTPAINILTDVISRNTEFDLLYLLRGIAYYQKGDFTKAETDLVKANNLNPNKEETLIYLARIYDQSGNVQKSIASFDQALKLNPTNENNLHDYAKMLYKEQLYTQSAIQYLKLIALNTDNQAGYKVELAKLDLDKIANYDEVLSLTNELINKWSGYSKASNSLKAEINTIQSWGKYQKEIKTGTGSINYQSYITLLQDSVTLDSTYVRTYYYLGKLYLSLKDFTKAKEMLSIAIDYDLTNDFTIDSKNLIETKTN